MLFWRYDIGYFLKSIIENLVIIGVHSSETMMLCFFSLAPSNDKTCGSRGGECTSAKQCSSGPKYLDAVDCDQKQGQVCCILI